MKSYQLIDLIAQRHTNDVFVPECKDGPTWNGTHLRMDAWAMSRSWSSPLVTGYECKVSRSDFIGDKKWPAYLKLCNSLYFVCPTGLIKPEELPAEVGLFWANEGGKRLVCKRKAVYRQMAIPEELYRYILMCRCRIVSPHHYERDRRQEALQWLAQKEKDRVTGWNVGRAIRETITKQIAEVETKNVELAAENKKCAEIKEILDALGVSIHDWRADARIRRALEQPMRREDLIVALNDAEKTFCELRRMIAT